MKPIRFFLAFFLTAAAVYSLFSCSGGKDGGADTLESSAPDSGIPGPGEGETSAAPGGEADNAGYADYSVYYDENSEAETTPKLVTAGVETIIADITLDAANIARFSNGSDGTDCSAAIQNAIYAVYNAGGGTVYLPEGVYRVGSPVTVMPFVSLSGAGGGTVIVVYTEPTEDELPALFTLGGSGGVRDLTVFYLEQSIDDPKPYPFTFNIPGSGEGGLPANYMLPCIYNVTVINGWRGVVASKYDGYVNEQIYISNFSGTFLDTGLELYNSADASAFRDITVSPSVWASFDAGKYGFAAPPDESAIAEYTGAHLSAYILGDLEWSQWQNISADACLYGLRAVKGFRASLSGIFYNLTLTGCQYGVTVEDMDTRAGFSLAITGGEIEGASYAVKNDTLGKISLVETGVAGSVTGVGASRVVTENYGLTSPAATTATAHMTSRLTVIDADKTAASDASGAVQSALDAAAAAGGGVVYLPAGRYRLESALNIPDNVELRGSGSLPTRDQMELSLGTMLFFYGVGGGEESDAFITLGENSGLYNIRAFCADVNQYAAYMENGKFLPQPFMVRVTGDNAVIKNFASAGAAYGIESSGAENAYIDGISIECYIEAVRVDGGSAYVGRVLDNLTVGFRNGWWKFENYASMFPNGREKNAEQALADGDAVTPFHITMDNLTELRVTGGASVRAENIFSYAARTTLSCEGSDVTAINLGRDCYYDYMVRESNPTLSVSGGGSLTVYNLHRFNGVSYSTDGTGSLEIYNRSTIYEDEGSFTGKEKVEAPFSSDGKYPKALSLDSCDSKDGWKGAKLDAEVYAQGSGSLSATSDNVMQLEKKFGARRPLRLP